MSAPCPASDRGYFYEYEAVPNELAERVIKTAIQNWQEAAIESVDSGNGFRIADE